MHAFFIAEDVLKSRAEACLRTGEHAFDDAVPEKYDGRTTRLARRLGQNEAILIRRNLAVFGRKWDQPAGVNPDLNFRMVWPAERSIVQEHACPITDTIIL